MALCHNISEDDSEDNKGGSTLWFFGASGDHATSIDVHEPYEAFKAATGAKGR